MNEGRSGGFTGCPQVAAKIISQAVECTRRPFAEVVR